MRKGSLIAALAAVATFVFVAGAASAQYPPPKETLVCVVEQVHVKVGETTRLDVTLRDASGAPIGGETVHFSVVSGTAELSANSATTDASGNASITVSPSTSGGVMLSARAEYSECRATIGEVRSIQPPATGSGGLTGNGDQTAALAAVVLTVLSLGMSSILLRRPRAS